MRKEGEEYGWAKTAGSRKRDKQTDRETGWDGTKKRDEGTDELREER
jgi:hypothetical protein